MKHWSISTSIREPKRIPEFLLAAQKLSGQRWKDERTQEDLYVHEIAMRVRTPTTPNLSEASIAALNRSDKEIPYPTARRIFEEKSYQDPPMRGRMDMKMLRRLGLVDTEELVVLTELGESLLRNEMELQDVVSNWLFKWQLPEPGHEDYTQANGYWIKPFVGTLALISRVNEIWKEDGHEAVGLKWEEFCTFAPTLIHVEHIERWAKEIIAIRRKLSTVPAQQQPRAREDWSRDFLESELGCETLPAANTLADYGDNVFRYFRVTGFIKKRGNGYYVDIANTISVEADLLISNKLFVPMIFDSAQDYAAYIQDPMSFVPPWKTSDSLNKIKANLRQILMSKGNLANHADQIVTVCQPFAEISEDLEISELRQKITEINLEQLATEARTSEFLKECKEDYLRIERREDISDSEISALNLSTQLEYLSYKTLLAIDDLTQIKPNYPVDDEGFPLFTAGAGVADIELFYADFNAICEVTTLTRRDQWVAEGMPVQRHLADFCATYSEKEAYGIFIAPRVHDDTKNTFRQAFIGGYGHIRCLKIVPFSFPMWCDMIEKILSAREAGKSVQQSQFRAYLDSLLPYGPEVESAEEWWSRISGKSRILQFM